VFKAIKSAFFHIQNYRWKKRIVVQQARILKKYICGSKYVLLSSFLPSFFPSFLLSFLLLRSEAILLNTTYVTPFLDLG